MVTKMMSSMLEKTMEQTLSLLRGTSTLNSSLDIRLKNLEEAILGTSRSIQQQNYREVIKRCLDLIKRKSQDMQLSLSEKRECVFIIAHLCNVHEIPTSAHPFIVKFIEDARTLSDKQLGYTTIILLNKSQGCDVYLAINTMLKDIASKSSSVACVALTTLASVVDVDLIPVFLPTLEKLLLKSGDSQIKCKVLSVLHAMVRIRSEFLVSIWDTAIRSLCDRDPHIMSNSLPIIDSLLKTTPPPKESKFVEKLIFILKQVTQGSLPIDMMYSGISGPWIQIRLLVIMQKLPKDWITKNNFSGMVEILSDVFARFHQITYIQVAIVTECINTVIKFHPELNALEKVILDTVDRLLLSSDANVLYSGIENLKNIVAIKPGFSQHYSDALLNALSDTNPSCMKLVLQLLDDFTTADESEKIVAILVKKLLKVSDFGHKREIFIGLLRILEKFPIKNEWLVENYLPLLGTLKNGFDFSLVVRVVKCLHTLPEDVIRKEVKELSKSLKRKLSSLQYCTVLEMISQYHRYLSEDEAKKAADDILDNCRRIYWRSNSDEIVSLSWNTVITLIVHHNLEIDCGKFSKIVNKDFSLMLRQYYSETVCLLKNSEKAKIMTEFSMLVNKEEKIDQELSFLDEYTKLHDTAETESVSEPKNDHNSENSRKDVAKFKTQPYSKSRFDTSETLTHDQVKPKKKFLSDEPTVKQASSTVWDSKKYNLEKDLSDDGNSNSDSESL